MEWQPIATAPKDRKIWAYVPETIMPGQKGRKIAERQMSIIWISLEKIRRKMTDRKHRPSEHAISLAEKHGGYWGSGNGHRPVVGRPTYWRDLMPPPQSDVAGKDGS